MSIPESLTRNKSLKILIIVFKIVHALSLTQNALAVNISDDLIAEVSSIISVVNCRGPVFVFHLSLLRSRNSIKMVKSWHLYYLQLGLRFYHSEVFYQSALGLRSWRWLCKQYNYPIKVSCNPVLALILAVFFTNPTLLSRCRFFCYI